MVIKTLQLLKRLLQIAEHQQFRRIQRHAAARYKVHADIGQADDNLAQRRPARQQVGKPRFLVDRKSFMQSTVAHVGIDDQHAFLDARQQCGKIGADKGFTHARRRTADHDDFARVAGKRCFQRCAQAAQRLHRNIERVLADQNAGFSIPALIDQARQATLLFAMRDRGK